LEPIDTIWNILMAALKPYSSIPASTLLTPVIAGVLALITTAANRLLVDVKRAAQVTKEVNAWRKEFDQARKTKDKKLLAKLTKKQEAMMKLQSQVAMERMKVSLIFIAPFYLVWIVLSGFFGSRIVAFSPIPLPFIGDHLSFFYWYLICSFTISLPLTRLFGINPEPENV
jgi:uncharacterized membrane protein (DUF106 family)